jgi:hypothetical protein
MPAPDPRLIDLINRSGPAHHQAFLEVDGWDPEWPIWYAEYFWEPIREFLPWEVTNSEITCFPVKAYKEWAGGDDWAPLPAGRLARDVTAPDPPIDPTHLDRELLERT